MGIRQRHDGGVWRIQAAVQSAYRLERDHQCREPSPSEGQGARSTDTPMVKGYDGPAVAIAAAGAIPGMRYAVQAADLNSWTTEPLTTPELENSKMSIRENRLALLLVGSLAVCAAATAN